MADQVQLKPATAADIGGVRALLEAAKLPTEGLEDQFGEGYAVLRLEGRIVAAAGMEVHGRCGLLRSAVVESAQRGTGLGARLVANRVAWARRRGLESVWLLTTTARDYFAHLGFSDAPRESAPPEIKASREFSAICPSSAACMRLDFRK